MGIKQKQGLYICLPPLYPVYQWRSANDLIGLQVLNKPMPILSKQFARDVPTLGISYHVSSWSSLSPCWIYFGLPVVLLFRVPSLTPEASLICLRVRWPCPLGRSLVFSPQIPCIIQILLCIVAYIISLVRGLRGVLPPWPLLVGMLLFCHFSEDERFVSVENVSVDNVSLDTP